MRHVNVTEFKANLSEYLRRVENEDIVVTRYGTPLAIVRGFTKNSSLDEKHLQQRRTTVEVFKSEGRFDGLEFRSFNWSVAPLQADLVESSLFANSGLFPDGSVRFDSALLMRGIRHEWHAQRQLHGDPDH